MQALNAWQLVGRLGVTTEREGWQATLDWRQTEDRYAIRIIGPFGQGTVELTGSGDFVVLRDSEGQSVVSDDPESLLFGQLGVKVPVEALRYWVLGLPAPGPGTPVLDAYGRLARLAQGGWTIEFLDYAPEGQVELPGRIFVRNDAARVRLVISRWELFPPKIETL